MKLAKLAKRKYLDLEFWLHSRKLAARNNQFSSFNEQNLIEKYIAQLKIADRSQTAVDIGAGDGIRRSNTYALAMNGWRVVGFECDSRNFARLADAYKYYPNASASRAAITPENVSDLLKGYSIARDFGVLSLDIDGCDYWVLDAILKDFRPRLVVSEYNEKIPPGIRFVVNPVPDFTLRHHFFGYSISQLKDLLAKHDYVLLEVEYNNVFLAPAELEGVTSKDVETAYREGYLNRSDRKEKFKANHDVEILHSLSPTEAVEFLNRFYSKFAGEYYLEAEKK